MYIYQIRGAKIDDKKEKFIFISYDNNSKRYKLYNPNNGKIVISRDLIFDKEKEWNFSSNTYDFNFYSFKENDQTLMEHKED